MNLKANSVSLGKKMAQIEMFSLEENGLIWSFKYKGPKLGHCSGLILGFVPSEWETALLRNDVSHWLGANLELALLLCLLMPQHLTVLGHYHVQSWLETSILQGFDDFI